MIRPPDPIFGQRAETLSQHLTRGVRVYVDGRLEARPWPDREGNVRAGLELLADTVELVSSRQVTADDRQDREPIGAGAGARTAARYATGSDDGDLADVPF